MSRELLYPQSHANAIPLVGGAIPVGGRQGSLRWIDSLGLYNANVLTRYCWGGVWEAVTINTLTGSVGSGELPEWRGGTYQALTFYLDSDPGCFYRHDRFRGNGSREDPWIDYKFALDQLAGLLAATRESGFLVQLRIRGEVRNLYANPTFGYASYDWERALLSSWDDSTKDVLVLTGLPDRPCNFPDGWLLIRRLDIHCAGAAPTEGADYYSHQIMPSCLMLDQCLVTCTNAGNVRADIILTTSVRIDDTLPMFINYGTQKGFVECGVIWNSQISVSAGTMDRAIPALLCGCPVPASVSGPVCNRIGYDYRRVYVLNSAISLAVDGASFKGGYYKDAMADGYGVLMSGGFYASDKRYHYVRVFDVSVSAPNGVFIDARQGLLELVTVEITPSACASVYGIRATLGSEESAVRSCKVTMEGVGRLVYRNGTSYTFCQAVGLEAQAFAVEDCKISIRAEGKAEGIRDDCYIEGFRCSSSILKAGVLSNCEALIEGTAISSDGIQAAGFDVSDCKVSIKANNSFLFGEDPVSRDFWDDHTYGHSFQGMELFDTGNGEAFSVRNCEVVVDGNHKHATGFSCNLSVIENCHARISGVKRGASWSYSYGYDRSQDRGFAVERGPKSPAARMSGCSASLLISGQDAACGLLIDSGDYKYDTSSIAVSDCRIEVAVGRVEKVVGHVYGVITYGRSPASLQSVEVLVDDQSPYGGCGIHGAVVSMRDCNVLLRCLRNGNGASLYPVEGSATVSGCLFDVLEVKHGAYWGYPSSDYHGVPNLFWRSAYAVAGSDKVVYKNCKASVKAFGLDISGSANGHNVIITGFAACDFDNKKGYYADFGRRWWNPDRGGYWDFSLVTRCVVEVNAPNWDDSNSISVSIPGDLDNAVYGVQSYQDGRFRNLLHLNPPLTQINYQTEEKPWP